jgi:hypothetical protein
MYTPAVCITRECLLAPVQFITDSLIIASGLTPDQLCTGLIEPTQQGALHLMLPQPLLPYVMYAFIAGVRMI